MTRVTVKQYAAEWRVTERTVRNWIYKGALQIERTPTGHIRICEPARGSGIAVLTLKDAEEPGNANT